jgi:hypothetical protein
MEFDYTEYEYLPECRSGCRALTGWLPSCEAADEVARGHEKQTGHQCKVQSRMKEWVVAQQVKEG